MSPVWPPPLHPSLIYLPCVFCIPFLLFPFSSSRDTTREELKRPSIPWRAPPTNLGTGSGRRRWPYNATLFQHRPCCKHRAKQPPYYHGSQESQPLLMQATKVDTGNATTRLQQGRREGISGQHGCKVPARHCHSTLQSMCFAAAPLP